MALITTLQNGDWNDTATWTGGVVPVVDVDTVSIGHVVDLTQDEAIGTSPASGTDAVTFTAGGVLNFNGYKLTVKGDVSTSGADATQLVMTDNSHLYFENAGAPTPATDFYVLNLAAQASGTTPALLVRGTQGARAVISSNPANIAARITGGATPYAGLVDAEFLTINHMGDASNDAWVTAPASGGSDALASLFRLNYVEFIDSGALNINVSGNHAKVELDHVTFKNTQDPSFSLKWFSYVEQQGVTSYRRITNNVFDKQVQLFAPQDVVIEGNQFHDSLVTSNTDKEGWASFDGNLVVLHSATENVFLKGDITNNYWLYDDPLKTNPHFLTIGGEDTQTTPVSRGNLFEFTGTNEEGDTQLVLSTKTVPTTITVEDNIVLPNAANGSSGTLLTALGNAQITLSINNNTGIPGFDQPVVALGETYIGHPDMVSSFQRNLGWDYVTREFLAADALPDDAVVDLLAAAVTQYNGMYNLETGTNGVGFTRFELSAGDLNATTVQADPLFVDDTRDFQKWDIFAGGTGDVSNALYQLSLANDDADYLESYNLDSLYSYVQEGFTPQQTAFVDVDGAGNYIGAVQPLTIPVYTTTVPDCICERVTCGYTRIQERELMAITARLLCGQQEHVDTETQIVCEPGTGQLVLLIYRFDIVGNELSVTAQYLDGTVYPGDISQLVDCGTTPQPTELTVETYQIDGGAAGVSTPSTGPGSAPTVGNTVTIATPFKALSWRYMRDTTQDPNDGTIGSLTVNGFTYYPGVGGVYTEVGQSLESSSNEQFITPYEFTVTGTARVEIVVHR